MNFKVTLTLLTLLSISCNNKGSIKKEEMGFKGQVKQVETTFFEPLEKYGEIKKGDRDRKNSEKEFDLKLIFDQNGHILSEEEFDGLAWYIYEYDDLSKLSRKIGHHEYGKTISYYEYKNDKLVKEIEYDIDGKLFGHYEYDYDFLGHLKQKTFFPREQYAREIDKYEYDLKGNIKRMTFEGYSRATSFIGTTTNIVELDYNEDNLLIRRGYIHYKYEFDSIGNWVKQIGWKSNFTVPVSYTERKLEYY